MKERGEKGRVSTWDSLSKVADNLAKRKKRWAALMPLLPHNLLGKWTTVTRFLLFDLSFADDPFSCAFSCAFS